MILSLSALLLPCISCGSLLPDETEAGPAVRGSVRVSSNRVYVSSPSVDVDVKRDNVPEVDFPAPNISVPSVNSVSPDFKVYLPEGISFDEMFEKAAREDRTITMDSTDTGDPEEEDLPEVLREEIVIPGKDTFSADSGASEDKKEPSGIPAASFVVTISGDSLSDLKRDPASAGHDSPLTLYYKMSDYTYKGSVLHGACTPMTMINCLNSFNGNGECTLNETLDLASRLGLWTPADGMSAEGIFITTAALNELHGTGNCAALSGPTDCDELGDIIDNGHTAGVCVDSSMLWKGVSDGYADHMIAVLETDRRPDGLLRGFKIIDNGMGKNYISADLYDECALNCRLGFCMVFGNPQNPPWVH